MRQITNLLSYTFVGMTILLKIFQNIRVMSWTIKTSIRIRLRSSYIAVNISAIFGTM